MMKKLMLLVLVFCFGMKGFSQKIPKMKIEEVVKYFTNSSDTVYVVNFWATFCTPCNEEIPFFIKISEKYKDQKVKLILVSLDLPSYYAVKLPAFIKKHQYKTNHIWLNETNADIFCPAIDEKWSGAIPATIFVNNKTGYRKFVEEEMSAEDFDRYLKEAIGGNALHKYVAPMNDADVIKENSGDYAHINEYVSFKSDDSSVYSIVGGKVKTIARIDDIKLLIIEKDALFYTYSNLRSTLIKTGDEVKADQLIGYAASDLNGYKPTVDLYISDAEKNILLKKEDFVKRKDIKLTDHSIDNNEPQ